MSNENTLRKLAAFLDQTPKAPAIQSGVPFLSYPQLLGEFQGRRVQLEHYFAWDWLSHMLCLSMSCRSSFSLMLGFGGEHKVNLADGMQTKFATSDPALSQEWLAQVEVSQMLGELFREFKPRRFVFTQGITNLGTDLRSSAHPELHIQRVLEIASALATSLETFRPRSDSPG